MHGSWWRGSDHTQAAAACKPTPARPQRANIKAFLGKSELRSEGGKEAQTDPTGIPGRLRFAALTFNPSPPPCMEAGGEGGVVLYALSSRLSLGVRLLFPLQRFLNQKDSVIINPSPPPCMEAGGEGGGPEAEVNQKPKEPPLIVT